MGTHFFLINKYILRDALDDFLYKERKMGHMEVQGDQQSGAANQGKQIKKEEKAA